MTLGEREKRENVLLRSNFYFLLVFHASDCCLYANIKSLVDIDLIVVFVTIES